jgi:hypothetical protein
LIEDPEALTKDLVGSHSRTVIVSGEMMGNGYSVLLAVCSAISPASFGRVLPICMGQNILANETIFFMPFIL